MNRSAHAEVTMFVDGSSFPQCHAAGCKILATCDPKWLHFNCVFACCYTNILCDYGVEEVLQFGEDVAGVLSWELSICDSFFSFENCKWTFLSVFYPEVLCWRSSQCLPVHTKVISREIPGNFWLICSHYKNTPGNFPGNDVFPGNN